MSEAKPNDLPEEDEPSAPAEPPEPPPAPPQRTVEELHAELNALLVDERDLSRHISKARSELHRALSHVGARPVGAERPTLTPPSVTARAEKPTERRTRRRVVSEELKRAGVLYSSTASTLALIFSVILPFRLTEAIPGWLFVALILGGAAAIAAVVVTFLIGMAAIYLAARRQPQEIQMVSAPSEPFIPPLHTNGIDQGVPVFTQRTGPRDPENSGDMAAWLKAIEKGEVGATDNFQDFRRSRDSDIDPSAI